MKKIIFILAGCAAMLATGCDKNDNGSDRFQASAQAQAALIEMYPDATDIACMPKTDMPWPTSGQEIRPAQTRHGSTTAAHGT